MNALNVTKRGELNASARRSFSLYPGLQGAHASSLNLTAVLTALSDYLLAILLVVLTGTIWTRYGYLYEHLNLFRFAVFALILTSGLFRLIPNVKRADVGSALIAIAAIVVGFACSVLFASSTLTNAALVFVPVACFAFLAGTLVSFTDFVALIRRYINVAVLFAAVSLVFFFLGSCLHVLNPTGITTFEWDWVRTVPSYYGLYYEVQSIDILMLSGYRNSGVFAEAPMFVFVLSIALILNVLFEERGKFKSAILIVTLITTFSTTAYIAIVLLLLSKYVFERRGQLSRQMKILIVPIAVFVAFAVVSVLLDDKSSTGSYGVRADHLLACWQVFCDSLPFGCGLGNTSAISQFMVYDQGLSVGLPYLFAETGIIGIILIAAPIVYGLCMTNGAIRRKLAVCLIVYIWLFLVTNVMFNSMIEWFFLMVVFFGLGRIHVTGEETWH